MEIDMKEIDWNSEQLAPFEKQFYKPHNDVSHRSAEQTAKLVASMSATVRGNAPECVETFEHMAPTFGPKLMQELTSAGFQTPSPVQKFAWPTLSSGCDSVCIAQTGSGKTLAFLMPGLNHIQHQKPLEYGDGPIALVMAPTRELAIQIQQECEKFGKITGIKSVACYGGADKQTQVRTLRAGVHIVVATPGRLMDLVSSGSMNLKRVTYLVLDEADRMLDMGFEKDIRKIVAQCRPDRQTMMFSATWPPEIQSMAKQFCRESPTMTTLGSAELQCNPDVVQEVRVVTSAEKHSAFMKWLEDLRAKAGSVKNVPKLLVFCDMKRACDALARDVERIDIGASVIHGDIEQHQRETAIARFKSGQTRVLLATDVAQRGLDIADIEYVVNYAMPSSLEDYVHRIGRTGRAGKKGTAITFFNFDYYNPEAVKTTRGLCKAITDVGQSPPSKLQNIASQG